MAMTLRLSEELDAELQALADSRGMSKQQLIVLAANDYLKRERRISRTLSNVDRVVRENGPLLDRLSQ